MSYSDGYTSLQSLLVFQAVAAQDREATIFEQISDVLKKDALFTADVSPDDGRLAPEALERLYLRLAKEEARNQVNGTTSPRNRSPALPGSPKPTNARHQARLAARQVPKLYGEYRSKAIADIRKEESKYQTLVKELASLQALSNDGSASQVASTQQKVEDQVSSATNEPRSTVTGDGPLRPTSAEVERPSAQPQPNPRRSNASIDSIINHDEPQAGVQQRPRLSGVHSNHTPNPQAFPSHDIHNAHLNHSHAAMNSPFDPRSSNSPHLPMGSHDIRHAPSPGLGQTPYTTSQSPQTPVILPPPPGMTLPTLPPKSPWSTSHDSTSAAVRPPSVPMSPRSANPLPHPQDPYGMRDRPQPEQYYRDSWRGQSNRPNSSRAQPPQPPYSPYQQQPSPSFPSSYSQQRGGVMLPPFQITPQASTSQHGMQLPRPNAQTSVAQSKLKGTPHLPQNHADEGATDLTPQQRPPVADHQHPFTVPSMSRLRKPNTVVSPGSSTTWKLLPDMPASERPQPRSVSPISDRENSTGVMSAQQGRSRRGRFSKANDRLKPDGLGRGTGPGTDTSSVRSQSITSQADDERTSRLRSPFKKPKLETPGTPIVDSVSGDDELTPATARPARRNFQATKRKRQSSNADMSESTESLRPVEMIISQQAPPDTIVASKNFGRMAKSILDIIASDKHASMFANPVNDRQAEGYSDIIKRPTDLKTIKTAITNGSKAVIAATADMQSQASPSSTIGSTGAAAGTVVLPVSDVLVPPKGIVNAAQLEQEVMRMFANAVMFNPGNDEIVQDTREMFKAVQGQLQQWRAGTEVKGDEVGEDDSMAGGSVKRKRTQY